jgi:hypothetical protein
LAVRSHVERFTSSILRVFRFLARRPIGEKDCSLAAYRAMVRAPSEQLQEGEFAD